MGVAELADLFGISRRAVQELVGRDVLVKTTRGQYPMRENVQRYTAHLRATAAGRGGEEAGADLASQRARLAREQADGIALKNAAARGTTIAAVDVAARWQDIARRVRGRLLAVSSRVRTRLPHLTASDVAAIDREVRAALEELTDARA